MAHVGFKPTHKKVFKASETQNSQHPKIILTLTFKPQHNTQMTIQNAQNQVDAWIKTVGVRYFDELTNTAILMEEVGEVARIMARRYGEQSEKESDKNQNLADELADVLWVVFCLANQTNINLTEALEKNFEKKNVRDANRHLQNPKLK